MTLDLYFARRFAWLFLRLAAGIFTLMAAIDVIEQLRRFSGQGVGLAEALVLGLLNTPGNLYRILPLVTILTAIALFQGLARSSELVAVRAAGRSGLRFLLAPVLAAMALGAGMVAVGNPLVAATSRAFDARIAALAQGGAVLSVSDSGLWLRQGGAEGQIVIRAARASADGATLSEVTFLLHSPEGLMTTRVQGAEARLLPGAWEVTGARRWRLDAENPERDAESLNEPLRIPTDLTPERIAEGFGEPRAISIWQLPARIAGLEAAGLSGRSHRMWLMAEIAAPAFMAAMVLIAAGFTMRPARGVKAGPLIIMALIAGFIVHFLRNFGLILGENGQIPLALAAAAPPAIATLLALGLLLHLEDG
jgi:lipopolysaccharide export system permease protein